MKLSISNIAWFEQDDEKIYELMKRNGFLGLEIAPTRIIKDNPYDFVEEAVNWKKKLNSAYGFVIPSMQSIWFGRSEKIFESEEERHLLVGYTKKAIDWAEAIGCRNLVFGCPRNRQFPDGADYDIGIRFFKELGDYAYNHNCIIGMEANPPIYNTNYINDTLSAIKLIEEVNSDGFKLNLDIGTMICNDESVGIIEDKVEYVSHVHISEPGLAPIKHRTLHKDLLGILAEKDYEGFVSIEMGNSHGLLEVEKAIDYVTGLI